MLAAKGWEPIVLYSFAGGTDGYTPFGGVAFDSAGNLYGTTYFPTHGFVEQKREL